ncbi:MAG TPA: single-stranded-DNA-specific exonuclease RecJ [Spongiibacteraceae bacterium]|nr:single-stranded-DNA-specific exonuclease RecJ [Spongiibacteraceae bacterium]
MQKTIRRREAPQQQADFSSTVNPLLARLYTMRGVANEVELNHELTQLSTPNTFKSLNDAAMLIADSIERAEHILVIGDFDADGATSCALSVLALRAMRAAHVDFLVPNRFEYGYGLTPEIVAVAVQSKPDLIITVDNGISSIDGVAAANAAGIRVLITDHHLPGRELPQAAAIVNPNQLGCDFPSKNLAGVGVIFYVLSALRNELRQRDWFARQGIAVPNLADYLDLVALGTVADVVSLDHNNRILVQQGLRRIRAGRARPGIKALLEVAKRTASRVVSTDLAFAIGPRLNAAGRLDDMSLGIQCLLTDDLYRAREIAQQLDELNHDRKAIEADMQREAMAALESIHLGAADALPWGICLYGADWHQGVIGILASRIKDRYHRPAIVFANADDGVTIKGSARSIPGLHIRDALDVVAAQNPGLLSKFGGHAMAAGLSLRREQFPEFERAFDTVVRAQLSEENLTAVLWSDGELLAEHMTLELAQALRDGGPWGQHFPEPLFDGEFLLVQQRLVGERHLKMVLAHPDSPQQIIDAIAFSIDPRRWPNLDVKKVRIAFRLDINEWRGKESVQLLVEYLEPV